MATANHQVDTNTHINYNIYIYNNIYETTVVAYGRGDRHTQSYAHGRSIQNVL